MLPCPVIALSATIGNFQMFSNWLRQVMALKKQDLLLIEHSGRWNDINTFRYLGRGGVRVPESPQWQLGYAIINFRSVAKEPVETDIVKFHPLALFSTPVGKQKLIASKCNLSHVELSTLEILQLWFVIEKNWSDALPKISHLSPDVFFKGNILKSEVFSWGADLKEFVRQCYLVDEEIVYSMLGDLEPLIASESVEPDFFSLLIDLDASEKLPAIIFSLDRAKCEKLTISVLKQLKSFERGDKVLGKSEMKKLSKRLNEIECMLDKDNESDPTLDAEKSSILKAMSPPKSSPELSFRGSKINEDKASFFLERLISSPNWQTDNFKLSLIEALHAGIGCHHAGLDKCYKGFL
jgi:ATP-dependent RNA helicase DDX60